MANKRIKDLSTYITAFRTGDVIPVDGPSGTAKMFAADLLKTTNKSLNDSNNVVITDTANYQGCNDLPNYGSYAIALRTFQDCPTNDWVGIIFCFGVPYYTTQIAYSFDANQTVYIRASYNGVYSNWTELAQKKYVDEIDKLIFVTDDTEYVWAVADKDGKILAGVKNDGSFYCCSKELAQKEYVDKIDKLVSVTDDTEYVWAVVDKDGKILAGVKNDGSFYCCSKELIVDAEKKIIGSPKPENFCNSGDGSKDHPFESTDGCAGIVQSLASLDRGGCVKLSAKDYRVTSQVRIHQVSTKLIGESMGYQGNPYAIHYGVTGSVISLGNEDARIIAGGGGQQIKDVGIYGLEPVNYKTAMQNMFDPTNPLKNCGITFLGSFDQGKISNVSLALLGAGIVLKDGSFDASVMDNINFDGCNTGFWCPNDNGTYLIHSYFEKNIFADMCGMAMYLRYLNAGFVKNNHISGIGAFISSAVSSRVGYKCVMYIGGYANIVDGNEFKNPGRVAKRIFNEGDGYYTDSDCIALVVVNSLSTIANNVFFSPSSTSLKLVGNNNVVSNNLAYIDSAVTTDDVFVVNGNNNVVSSNISTGETSSSGSLVVNGSYNVIYGNKFDGKIVINGNNNKLMCNFASEIVDNGTDNTII